MDASFALLFIMIGLALVFVGAIRAVSGKPHFIFFLTVGPILIIIGGVMCYTA